MFIDLQYFRTNNIHSNKFYPNYGMSSSPTIHLPIVLCLSSNHHKQPFEYICLNKSCVQHKQNPLCFYCLKQSHEAHTSQTLSLREFVSQCLDISNQKNNQFSGMTNEQHSQFYQLEDMLINALPKCKSKLELSAMIEQIYKATFLAARFSDSNEKRIQKVINHQLRQLSKETHNFYKTQINSAALYCTSKTHKSLTTDTQFSIPILTFHNSLPSAENFSLISPFEISHHKSNTISSITAHPSLSTFCESIQIYIKVIRLTPNWMGIGISLGEHKYQQKSKNHITLLSNGWLNERGEIIKNDQMKYEAGHVLRIQWNKDKKQLIFKNINTRHQEVIRFEPEWNEQVYLCSTMFFKNDSIYIVQCGQE